MIIDVHAHALSDRFIRDLATTPVAGLKSETSPDGYYAIRRAGDDRKSTLDPHLFDLEHRLASLKRRKVELQLRRIRIKDRKFNGVSGSMVDAGCSRQSPSLGRHGSRFAEKPAESHRKHCLISGE